jgi:exopolysaccharide production protein ExoY
MLPGKAADHVEFRNDAGISVDKFSWRCRFRFPELSGMTAHFHELADHKDRSVAPITLSAPVLTEINNRTSQGKSAGLYRRAFKRVFDLLAVIISLPVILPVVLCLAAMVAVSGGNPFYSQLRIGRGGRVYRMWKLRTMVKNAEDALEAHLAADMRARAEWDSSQKLKHDPRITPVGRLLRKSSLDELPQLWNVLRGEMSLVGPRPMMVDQQSLYSGDAYYRLQPGITGIWQVSYRNDTSFADRARFDAEYDRTLSFRTDLGLLLATVRVVLRGTGY